MNGLQADCSFRNFHLGMDCKQIVVSQMFSCNDGPDDLMRKKR